MDDDLAALVRDDTREKMVKAIDHVRHEMGNVRTGRPSSALVETLVVDYYGTPTPLRQLAGFSVPDAMLLVISPYDKGSLGAIEKAIMASDLGINPANDGAVIRLAFPPLTEERRKELVKVVRHKAEEGRVADPEPAAGGPPRARVAAEGRRALHRRARSGGEGTREDHPRTGGADRPGALQQRARVAAGLTCPTTPTTTKSSTRSWGSAIPSPRNGGEVVDVVEEEPTSYHSGRVPHHRRRAGRRQHS